MMDMSKGLVITENDSVRKRTLRLLDLRSAAKGVDMCMVVISVLGAIGFLIYGATGAAIGIILGGIWAIVVNDC